jgi:parallel beta-helix repeat protein
MNEKLYALIIGIIILGSSCSLIGASQETTTAPQRTVPDLRFSSIIYVDDNNTGGPWDGSLEHPYQTIQDGIDHALAGDTVYVFSGYYLEQININITINVTGENTDTTIIDGNNQDQIVTVTADMVNISSFTIQNGVSGIRPQEVSATHISQCTLTTTEYGINLYTSPSSVITDCLLYDNRQIGILAYASPSTICINCILYGMQAGIYLSESPNAEIQNCQINDIGLVGLSGGGTGIYAEIAEGCTISGCTISNCSDFGVYLSSAGFSTITNCVFTNNHWDPEAPFPAYYHSVCISISMSPDCQIRDCLFTNNDNGLFIGGGCANLKLRNTTFENNTDGSFDVKAGSIKDFYFDIDTTNVINGKPMMYLIESRNLILNESLDISFLGLVSCVNIKVLNLTIEGMIMAGTTDSQVSHVHSSLSKKGFMVVASSNDTLVDCEASDCEYGIYGSSANLLDSKFYDNDYGICLPKIEKTNGERSNGNVINCSSYQNRVGFYEEKGSMIQGCHVYDNTEYGFILGCNVEAPEDGSTLQDNSFFNNTYNFYAEGWQPPGYSYHDIDLSNTVNGKPIYYLINAHDQVLDGAVDDIGCVVLVLCDNMTLRNIQVTHNKAGVLLVGTTHSLITDSSFSDNKDGIWLYTESANNTITNTHCFSNERGIAAQEYAWYTTILNCELNNNSQFGFWTQVTGHMVLKGCIVHDNGYAYSEDQDVYPLSLQYGGPGVMIHVWSESNRIENCRVFNNYEGIYVYDQSDGQIIRNCTVYGNTVDGLCLRNEKNCVIKNCTAYKNQYGFAFVEESSLNKITDSTAYQNEIGMYIVLSSNNNQIYHNNFFGNTQNALDKCHNTWDTTTPPGGNYWDDYTGVDANGDGIGDTPYPIPGESNEDRYPYMDLDGWKQDDQPPVYTSIKPWKGLYFNDNKIMSLIFLTIIVKGITIAVNVSDNKTGIDHVEFYIDDTLKATVTAAPYEWLWDEKTPFQFRHQIKIVAYDGVGNAAEKLIRVWKFR